MSAYSDNYKKEKAVPAGTAKTVLIYCGISLFCIVFHLVYHQFSHDVTSPYMTYLFAWPLVLGAIPATALWLRDLMLFAQPARSYSGTRHPEQHIYGGKPDIEPRSRMGTSGRNPRERKISWRILREEEPVSGFLSLYRYGIACVTVSSLLRGIFEIAGTGSVYQTYLMIAGLAMLLLGAIGTIYTSSRKVREVSDIESTMARDFSGMPRSRRRLPPS